MEKKKKLTKGIIYTILSLISFLVLAPLVFLLINSFKGQADIINYPLLFPYSWDPKYLIIAFEKVRYFQAFLITMAITISSVTLLVMVSSLSAWVMVRNKTKASGALLLMFTAAMLVPFQSVMYPLLRLFENMGLKNSFGLVLMYGGFGLSFSVFLYHGFIKSIPASLEEAALIDGANIFQMFFRVIFPLLKSTTVTVIILNSMWIWNDYLLPFLVIGNKPNKTLTLELYFARLTAGQYGNPWELIFPAVLLSIIPIIIVFLLLQKYIVKGIADGAVKG